MKLLFDENLSPRLVRELSSHWPGSTHIELLGMRGASWAFSNMFELIKGRQLMPLTEEAPPPERPVVAAAALRAPPGQPRPASAYAAAALPASRTRP